MSENLEALKAIRHHDTVANHQGRRSATQCRPNLIRIKSLTVIMMVRVDAIERVATMTVNPSKRVHLGHHHHILDVIAVVDHRDRRILRPYIYAETALTRSFQCRAIDPVGPTVVLPGEIVFPLRMNGAVTQIRELRRSPFDERISVHAIPSDIGSYQQFSVMSPLARDIQSCPIQHSDTVIGGVQSLTHFFKRQLYHLLTIHIRRISHLDHQLRFGLYESCCQQQRQDQS